MRNNSIWYVDCAMIDGWVEEDEVGNWQVHGYRDKPVEGDFLALNNIEADRFKCKLEYYTRLSLFQCRRYREMSCSVLKYKRIMDYSSLLLKIQSKSRSLLY